jgi:hypothetical protein
MLYLSGAEGYAWYASFARRDRWQLDEGYQVAPRELESFENAGREMESVLSRP